MRTLLAIICLLSLGSVHSESPSCSTSDSAQGLCSNDRQTLLQSNIAIDKQSIAEPDTETCVFGMKGVTCEVPNAKSVCCTLLKRALPCEERPDHHDCQTKAYTGMKDQFIAAGFDVTQERNSKYWKSFCPALDGFEDKVEKYCKATDGSASTSELFTFSLSSVFEAEPSPTLDVDEPVVDGADVEEGDEPDEEMTLEDMMGIYDKDSDGKITLAEVIHGETADEEEKVDLTDEDKAEIERHFKQINTDGSGFISKEQLPELLEFFKSEDDAPTLDVDVDDPVVDGPDVEKGDKPDDEKTLGDM